MIKNSRAYFSDGSYEDFHDPYIFEIGGSVFHWNGFQWNNCTSTGCPAIEGTLTKIQPKSLEDPPPGFKRYK